MALTRIDSEVKSVCRQLGLGNQLSLLERAWNTELGTLSGMAQIVALDKGSLVVETGSAPAMQEISLRRKELLRRINRYFPTPFVNQISVRVNHE